jgi:hypothetical protein
MNIVEQNEGKKIPYLVNGTKITFDDMLTIDLKRYQKDEEKVIDISLDEDDILKMGLGRWYVANIILPPKEYEFTIKDDEEVKVDKPLDMNKVSLTLWALPFNYEFLKGGM